MDIERAGMLVLSVVAAVVLSSIAWKLFSSNYISGSRLSVLDGINRYAEKCLSMDSGDCFVVDVHADERVEPADVSSLSPDFSIDRPIPPGDHRLKFTNSGGTVKITVVE